MALKVEDMMKKKAITIDSVSAFKQAADTVNESEICCLTACKKSDAVPIVTERLPKSGCKGQGCTGN